MAKWRPNTRHSSMNKGNNRDYKKKHRPGVRPSVVRPGGGGGSGGGQSRDFCAGALCNGITPCSGLSQNQCNACNGCTWYVDHNDDGAPTGAVPYGEIYNPFYDGSSLPPGELGWGGMGDAGPSASCQCYWHGWASNTPHRCKLTDSSASCCNNNCSICPDGLLAEQNGSGPACCSGIGPNCTGSWECYQQTNSGCNCPQWC